MNTRNHPAGALALAFLLTAVALPAAAAPLQGVFGGFYGVRVIPDRHDPNAAVIAGSPGSLDALGRGIRCEFRTIVLHGERQRYRHCE